VIWGLLAALLLPARADPCATLARFDVTPARRRSAESALREGPADARWSCARALLDAEGPLNRRVPVARRSGLDLLLGDPHPAAAADLFRLFARSRMGDLPEDPDLFERALRVLGELPDDAVAAGLAEGLAPVLLDLAHQALIERWVRPLTGDRTVIAVMTRWPATHPDRWAALHEHLARDLQSAHAQHGAALIHAMSTEGGSVAVRAAQRADVALLAAWRDDPHPKIAALAERISDARSDELSGVLRGDLGPPDTAPGQIPGLEAIPPRTPPSVHATPGSGPPRPASPLWSLAIGVGLLLSGIRLSARAKPLGVLAGVGLLVLIEAGLRLAGTPPLASRVALFSIIPEQTTVFDLDIDGERWWSTGGGSIRARLFPEEPPGVRLFALGASSVHGSHYLAEETFAALLETALDQPQHPVEVINLGLGGANSDHIRRIGRASLDLHADGLLIYYGHNEEAQFSRLAQWEGTSPLLIAARMLLSRSALYASLMAQMNRPGDDRGDFRYLQERHFGRDFSADPADPDDLRGLARANLRWNLDALLRDAGRAGVPVILMQPATNYRFAHITPRSGDEASIRALLDEAEALAAAGQPGDARSRWQEAIDRGATPREVTSQVREIIADLAAAHDCALLDVDGLLAARAGDGLTASGLFWDDLHLSRSGHAAVAEALEPLAREILAREMLAREMLAPKRRE